MQESVQEILPYTVSRFGVRKFGFSSSVATSMIAMGIALGIGVLDKQVATLEKKFKYKILKKVYAGVHQKPADHPDLVAFFKFKCWN